jgi:tetratricopeptide (TPR) repeat protein
MLANAASGLICGILLSGCITAYLEEGNQQIQARLKEQSAEIEQNRKDLEDLRGQTLADLKRQQCNRAFREYFDRAQLATDREQAITLYRQGLGVCPDDDVAHYELGRALADAGRFGEAEKSFEEALKINPDFTEARKQLDAIRKNR